MCVCLCVWYCHPPLATALIFFLDCLCSFPEHHQLSPSAPHTQTTKLKWLQNCVLSIDPADATIRVHLPVVLRQLKGALTASTPTISQRGGTDVAVVRLTTHVVNSLGSQLPPAGASEGGV